MTMISNTSKKPLFVMSESSDQEILDRIRENVSMYRISDSRIFECKQKTGLPDPYSNEYLYKEVSISGGDESHIFKCETISSIVEFAITMENYANKYKTKDRVSDESLGALGGENPKSEKKTPVMPKSSNDNTTSQREMTPISEQQQRVPVREAQPLSGSVGDTRATVNKNAAISQQLYEADIKLNSAYKATLGRLDQQQQTSLRNDQRNWVKQRDAAAAVAKEPSEAQSIILIRTIARTRELERYQ